MMYSSPKATIVDIFRSAEEKPNKFNLNITLFLSTYPAIFYIIDLFYFRLSLLKNPEDNYLGISACLPF